MATAMTRPCLSLLGGLDFAGDAPAVTRKARAMVAYLALQSGRSQSREKLAALLWGRAVEAQARTNLRQALSSIRRAMRRSGGHLLLADGDRIILNLDDAELDVARFEHLAAGSGPESLEQAIALYRGDLLDGFSLKEEPFEEWLRAERERLRMMAITALEKLVVHYFETNRLGSCVRAATRLLASEPLREDIHVALMQAYAAQGRFNLALRQYERCRDVLAEQLRVQPMPETRRLYEDLRPRRVAAETRVGAAPGSGAPVVDGSRFLQAQAALQFQPEAQAIRPPTLYVKSAGASIAYQVTGDGPFDMVYVQGWVSNLDYAWESPRLTHVLRRLGSCCRLIRIDKRGTGLSDRSAGFPTLEARMEDVRAVLDAVGSRPTVLFGSSEGGILCMLLAASYPERTRSLVLHGAYAAGLWSPDYPWGRTRPELEEELAAIEREWGKPADLSRAAPSLMNDTYEREWFAAYLRNSASPADAVSLWRWSTEIDIRDVLPAIRVPTLIVQRTGDRWVKADEGRYLARHIRDATYVELPGDDHLIWGADSDRLVDTVQEFLAGTAPPVVCESALLTIMQVEILGALRTAGTGDPMRSCRDDVERELRCTEGREIGRTATGLVAVFERPSRAIRCAVEFRDRMKQAGLDMRAAIHIGECEKRGDDVSGLAIQLTASLLGHAKPGDILASRTVRELEAGSNLAFDPGGEVELPGSAGHWPFFSVGGPVGRQEPP